MTRRANDKDGLYCPFYQKNGACMHGGACSRMHVRPQTSRTILLANLYPNPQKFISLLPRNTLVIDHATIDRNFDEFYTDIYEELRTFGPLSDLLVADNLCDHLVGNVLVKFDKEDDAVAALASLRRRWYAGRPIDAQFSPVENFQQATCRQLAVGGCRHGGNCNFVHPRYPSDEVMKACPLSEHVWNSDDVSVRVSRGDAPDRPRRDDRDDRRRDWDGRENRRRARDERDGRRGEWDDRDERRRERKHEDRHRRYDRERDDDRRRRDRHERDYERAYERR